MVHNHSPPYIGTKPNKLNGSPAPLRGGYLLKLFYLGVENYDQLIFAQAIAGRPCEGKTSLWHPRGGRASQPLALDHLQLFSQRRPPLRQNRRAQAGGGFRDSRLHRKNEAKHGARMMAPLQTMAAARQATAAAYITTTLALGQDAHCGLVPNLEQNISATWTNYSATAAADQRQRADITRGLG